MADEEKKEQEQQEPQTDEEEGKEASAETEAPAEVAEEEGNSTSEDEPPAGNGGEAEASGGDIDEDELSFKERLRLERSRQSGAPGPQRSAEQRATERIERRSRAAAQRRAYRAGQRRKKGEPGQGTPPAERATVAPKVRQGTVVSSKPDKTIRVRIEAARRHAAYEKIVRRSSTLHAHDERNEANEGDVVRVVETRPLSRTKRWRLLEILEKAK